ncbi:MAG TPA: CHC2 zinc finger domain-containing protein [Micropepsaceae bacterium]|jgi:hypothetical protein
MRHKKTPPPARETALSICLPRHESIIKGYCHTAAAQVRVPDVARAVRVGGGAMSGANTEIAAVRDRVDLAALIGRRVKLARKGRASVGLCPFHSEKSASFKVENGRFICFGCGARGDCIDFLMQADGLSFREALRALSDQVVAIPPRAAARSSPEAWPKDDAKRIAGAIRIWNESGALRGTPGWRYLQSRGIDTDALSDRLNEVLRWHPRCPWKDGTHGCVIALWTDALMGEPRAIHRTGITAGGEKIGRLALGPKKNCVIRLWPEVTQSLVAGEGIETVLAAATRLTHRGCPLRPAWAVGDAGGLAALPVLPGIESLTLLVDHDINEVGQRAAATCSSRWTAAGIEVRRLLPKAPDSDFNDVVVLNGAWHEG